MGKSSRSKLSQANVSPGPGAYEQRSKVLEGPRHAMAGRHSQSVVNFVPGPGQYEPNYRIRQSSTKYSMGGRPATASAVSARGGAPGPGSYDVHMGKERIGGRFGKDPRQDLSQSFTRYVPGPGAYEPSVRAAVKGNAPRYTYSHPKGIK